MPIGIAILALSLAVAGLAIAIASDVRTRRATRELARELVTLRARLLQAEREGNLDARAPVAEDAAAMLASIGTRMAELEALQGRLHTVLSRRANHAPEADGHVDAETLIVRRLHAQGYDAVVVLEVRADGALLVEAEREGLVAKGIARVGTDGSVTVNGLSSVRAFP